MKEEMRKISELLDNLNADKYPLQNYDLIGKRGVRRLDGYEKASGRAVYTIDIQLPLPAVGTDVLSSQRLAARWADRRSQSG